MTRTEQKRQILAALNPVLTANNAKLGADAITPPPRTGQVEVRLYCIGDEYNSAQGMLRNTQYALTLAGWEQDPMSDLQELLVLELQKLGAILKASEVDYKFVLPNMPDKIYIFEQLSFEIARIV